MFSGLQVLLKAFRCACAALVSAPQLGANLLLIGTLHSVGSWIHLCAAAPSASCLRAPRNMLPSA
jgi:hypothetical protein